MAIATLNDTAIVSALHVFGQADRELKKDLLESLAFPFKHMICQKRTLWQLIFAKRELSKSHSLKITTRILPVFICWGCIFDLPDFIFAIGGLSGSDFLLVKRAEVDSKRTPVGVWDLDWVSG